MCHHITGISLLFPLCSLLPVTNYKFDRSKQCVSNIMIQVDFLQKKSVDSSPYDSDLMAKDFVQHFNNQAFSVDQQVSPALTGT